jgi:hypothetical protein
MKLPANAARSVNKRRVLVQRVVEEDWYLAKAAATAEVSEPTARKWSGRYRPTVSYRAVARSPDAFPGSA